ncbi:MAG: thioredoxin family protein [Pseudomonadota bacterium]
MNTPPPALGTAAPDFSLPTADGQQSVSLADAMGPGGLVVAFICNHCPYVLAVAERMVEDFKALQAKGVAVVAIMSNDWRRVPDDAPDKMVAFAERYGFDFPYLVDETQDIARAYGAVCTPDFFGYDAAGKLAYRGRLDDARMGDGAGRTPELLNAMLAVADGKSGPLEEAQKPSMGCSIKWSG